MHIKHHPDKICRENVSATVLSSFPRLEFQIKYDYTRGLN